MPFVARQPILTCNRTLFGYEILFRDGIENSFQGTDLELASTSAVDTSLLIGLDRIAAGHPMFTNCPRDFLLREYISLFHPRAVVVEVLESIRPDEEIVDSCRRLKQTGYSVALDDFVDGLEWAPLIELTDFIKIDFRATTTDEQQALAMRYASRGICMLAEKVETPEEYRTAMALGYSLF